MKGIRHRKKITNGIIRIIASANETKVKAYLDELKEFREIADKIPETDQNKYQKYFEKHMTREINLLRIEFRKIEMHFRELLHRTNKRAAKFEERLSDKRLPKDMIHFYQKEFLNILKPKYILEQVADNYKKYIEVVNITKEEFSEWFFLGRIDFVKQLLKPYIVEDSSSNKKEEIWIYKLHQKGLTLDRKKKMYERVGLKINK
ncbi:MAG: hypothetical protein ACTSSH_04880 [Candidatus Heimdallarchaeota archaeon]